MTKVLTIVASMHVPDDEFERADVLAQIRPVIEALKGSLHTVSAGSATVSHAINTQRAPKEAAPVVASVTASVPTAVRHKPEHVHA